MTPHHENISTRVEELVERYRQRFLIPPRWDIHVAVLCPDEIGPGIQASTSWEYLANAQYRIKVSCDLDPQMLDWVIAHELLEAMLAPYADFTEALISRRRGAALRAALEEQHADIRNEAIEWLLHIILENRRPNPLQAL